MNFSPAMYDEFIKPYDQVLHDEFGGGAMHFCGRGDHFINSASGIKDLYAVNLTQPQYNDMEIIFRNTVDKGIKLIGFDGEAAREAIKSGRDLHSNIAVLDLDNSI
jgi:hypothetical protein